MATNVVDMVRDIEPPLYDCYIGERLADQPPHSKNQKKIDLAQYKDPGPIKDRAGNILADFQHHMFLDLDEVDTESEVFTQEGTKQTDVEELEVDNMVDNLRLDGYVKEDTLPQYDTDKAPINGRVRTRAMKRKSETVPTVYGVDARWLPISVFKWRPDVTLRQKNCTYGRLNKTRPHTIQNRKTFIKEGVALCAAGVLDPYNSRDVTHYVREESAAGEVYTDIGGNLQKIIDAIVKRGQAVQKGIANTKTLTRPSWVKKLNNNGKGYVLENKVRVLTSVDEVTYAYRALTEHILPAIREDKHPVEFILYTNKDDANEAKEAMNKFVELLDTLWRDAFDGVTKVVRHPQKTTPDFDVEDFDKPYIILGAVPQVIGRHDLASIKLIPIDKY